MKTFNNFYATHRMFITLMLAAALSGFVFMFTNNLDFIVEALNQEKYNFSNAAYSVSKVIMGILIPLTFVIPSQTEMGRIKGARLLFVAYGVMHLIMLSWIIPYVNSGATDMVEFQSSLDNLYVVSYVLWDTYSWAGSAYTLVIALLSIFIGLTIDDNKRKVCICVLLLPILRLLLPIITNLATGNGILSVMWITNNYADIIAMIAITIAFFIASIHDATWITLIWNQEYESGTDDEIE